MNAQCHSIIRWLAWRLALVGSIALITACEAVGPQSGSLSVTGASDSAQAAPVTGNDLSGLYVSSITSNDPTQFRDAHSRLILTLQQTGQRITAIDSQYNTEISGILDGDVITFEINSGQARGLHRAHGEWVIQPDRRSMTGFWQVSDQGSGGHWNLRKLENAGVELFSLETGIDQPFRIRDSHRLFDTVFNSADDRNVVFYIHGRGKAFSKEFEASRLPYTESASNTRFIIVHWLSWGDAGIRPYRHARKASTGLTDFLFAFNDYKAQNPETVGNRNITLLAQSMGNIPFKVFLEEHYEAQALPQGLLDSVVLSSADVPIAEHRHWVEKIDFANTVHILQNQRDLVLSLSTVVDNDIPGERGPKLGRGFDDTTYSHVEDLAGNAQYIDLTLSTSFGHRPFNLSAYPTDTNATRLFNQLLNGQHIESPEPASGLYQIPDFSPVVYFHSSGGIVDEEISENEAELAQTMANYIESRGRQLHSEAQRQPELVKRNTGENTYLRAGDWRPAKGEWKTVWRVSSGALKATIKIIDDTRVTYNYRGGRILFYSIDDSRTWKGYWIEDIGSRKCLDAAKDGSRHWGNAVFQFNASYTRFEGSWDYCGQGETMYWRGSR